MGICWYCHWGWSAPVAAIYERAGRDLRELAIEAEERGFEPVDPFSAMHFGPAHIVWEDENFGRDSVQWCLDEFEHYRGEACERDDVAAIVRRSLEELLALPDHVLAPEPEDYDDEHPERFPPKVEMAAKP